MRKLILKTVLQGSILKPLMHSSCQYRLVIVTYQWKLRLLCTWYRLSDGWDGNNFNIWTCDGVLSWILNTSICPHIHCGNPQGYLYTLLLSFFLRFFIFFFIGLLSVRTFRRQLRAPLFFGGPWLFLDPLYLSWLHIEAVHIRIMLNGFSRDTHAERLA